MNTLKGRLARQNVYVPGSGTGGGGGWPPTTDKVQEGSVDLTIGQDTYAVVFSPALASTPSYIGLQNFVKDSGGESFWGVVDISSVSVNGFTFYLSGLPTATGGKMKYFASI